MHPSHSIQRRLFAVVAVCLAGVAPIAAQTQTAAPGRTTAPAPTQPAPTQPATQPPTTQTTRPATPTSPAPAPQEFRFSPSDTRTADRDVAREYTIGAGDVLEVVVWDNTVISRTVPVRPDGRVSLPLLRDVQAAGVTPAQLEEMLTKALTGFIQNPVVSVIVREVHSFKVSVLGQVKTPGRYELTSRVTVLDTLAMAGGLTEFADKSRIVVLRRDGATTWQIPFPYDRLSSGSALKPSDNFFVQPNDIILVR